MSLTQAAASEEEVLNAAKKAKNYPVLVVRGMFNFVSSVTLPLRVDWFMLLTYVYFSIGGSLFDEHSKFDVVLVQKVIRASSATEGFLVLLLSFFVFNCDYPTDLHSTMEFCQRYCNIMNYARLLFHPKQCFCLHNFILFQIVPPNKSPT